MLLMYLKHQKEIQYFRMQETLSELLIKKRSAVLMKHIITPHTEILSELQTATMNFYE